MSLSRYYVYCRPVKFCCLIFLISQFSFQVSLAQNKTNESKAQVPASKQSGKFEFGITGGAVLNKFTNNQPQTGYNTGYNAGLFINYTLYKGLSLQAEANLLQQGGQLITFKDDTRFGLPESIETKNVTTSSVKLNSIEIPLLVKYTFKVKQTWMPAIYAGGSYAYLYNATDHYKKTGDLLPGEDFIATITDSRTVTNQYDKNRFNFIAGASIKLPLVSKVIMLIDFRYLQGITPAREDYSYTEKSGFGTDIRSNSFITKFGIILPL
ncbi:porin family protein [Mucilaginibacter sp.]|uniref:porin family protein n=1 Tax=Mucilaginibacter sp. TaxID=1882438 RepID=UPI0035BBCC73